MFSKDHHSSIERSNVPHKPLERQEMASSVTHTHTDRVVAEPGNVPFIPSVEEDRSSGLPPLTVHQIPLLETARFRSIEMVQLRVCVHGLSTSPSPTSCRSPADPLCEVNCLVGVGGWGLYRPRYRSLPTHQGTRPPASCSLQ